MLTIIPLFKSFTFKEGYNGYAVANYPIVGFILGLLVYAAFLLLESFVPYTHLAVILFAFSILLYGGLHLDGLSDTIDAVFSYKEKDEALKIMKDPRIGALGAVFLLLFLILKLSSFIHLDNFLILAVIFMLSRFAAAICIYYFPYISVPGMGSKQNEEFKFEHLMKSVGIVFFLGILVMGLEFLFFFFITVVFTLLLSFWFIKKFGGLNGDMYGTVIELNEILLLQFLIIL